MLLALAGGLAMSPTGSGFFVTIMAGHLTNMQHYLVTVDHYYSVGSVRIVLVGTCFWPSPAAPCTRGAACGASACDGVERPVGAAVALAIAALAAGPAWSLVQPRGSAAAAAPPPVVAGCPAGVIARDCVPCSPMRMRTAVEYFSDAAGPSQPIARSTDRSDREGAARAWQLGVRCHYRELEAEALERAPAPA